MCERQRKQQSREGESERGGPQGNRGRQKRRVGGWEHMKGENLETERHNVATQSLCACKTARDPTFFGFLMFLEAHTYVHLCTCMCTYACLVMSALTLNGTETWPKGG